MQNNLLLKRIPILDTEMAYVDIGSGNPIVFLHGNPTSSYLWRNIIPHLKDFGRCLAPDLVGMGQSGGNPAGTYRFVDHYRYLEAWFDAVGINENVILVLHDWGSALGFHWAYHQRNRIRGIVYMEAIVRPITWDEWPEPSRKIFQAIRTPAGEEIILNKNVFVTRILPTSMFHKLNEEELSVYNMPFLKPGESRRPTLTWPRELPIEGEPKDVHDIAQNYANWLSTSPIPKLFINAEPGAILTGAQREFCRAWPNQLEITVKGIHYIQEDSPDEIGEAIAAFVQSLTP